MSTMKLNNIIFIDNYPSLDIHGYDREYARLCINDYINDNIKMKNEIIVIIHGKGTGVLKKTTNETLNNNKHVIDYKSWYYNDGCTVVLLNLTK